MRAALAPIPAEPWDAQTAERRIADHAPTPAGAARREPPRDARNIAGRRADAPTRRRTGAQPKAAQPPLLPPAAPATAPAIRARK
ncbi:polyketide synthase [Burkholderia multivorans CGD1]|nr:polyketide synthase [Burkholderia multivorans CGD1]